MTTKPAKFDLLRVDVPASAPRMGMRRSHSWSGDEGECGFNIPLMFRALAHPGAPAHFVGAPVGAGNTDTRADHQAFRNARAYWTSLLNLLIYSFGWRYPGKGLREWVDAGMPDDDPRLALIKQAWVADGQFDTFCAWLWQPYAACADMARCLLQQPSDRPQPSFVQDGLAPKAWIDRVSMTFNGSRLHDPLNGGTDPLHLQAHTGGDWGSGVETRGARLEVHDNGARADLFLASMYGWHRVLTEMCSQLRHPDRGRSVRVSVHVPHIGTLGEFRRSRDTGIWFAGPHSLHMLGNSV
ncbi:MAG: hypothetical protein ACO36A_02350 [Ilumatobacteraceae bacterium]